MSGSDILIVDDEEDIRELVAGILEDEGHNPRTAFDADSALAEIRLRRPQLVFLDIWLKDSKLDGMEILELIKEEHPDLPVVMISGHGNIETAVLAIRKGAYDFIEKPFKVDRLVLVVERALEAYKLRREIKELKQSIETFDEILGNSAPVQQLRQAIAKMAPTNSRIMIFGGAGSGKELVARALHKGSARAKAPFIAISAATMTAQSMEEALFGVEDEQGKIKRVGALEEAHGGTLYLEGVSDMPRETQAKILRVLTDQTFVRVNGSTRVQVDVRIISSTSVNLEDLIAKGDFREDLYHRLNVVPLRVPTLKERAEDIPMLVDVFMKKFCESTGNSAPTIAPDAMAVLMAHEWPGNIRELRNNVERMMILAAGEMGGEITAEKLPPEVGMAAPSLPSGAGGEKLLALPLREAREEFEKEYLNAQIGRFGGNISKTAEFIGMERSALHRKLKSLQEG